MRNRLNGGNWYGQTEGHGSNTSTTVAAHGTEKVGNGSL